MTTQSSAESIATIKRYLAAYNAFDVAGMLAVLSPQVQFEHYSGGQLTAAAGDIAEFSRLAEQSRAIFSEREQRLIAIEQRDGALMAAIAFRGRLCADIPDGPAAGTVLALQGTSAFSFDGALIAKIVDRS